MDDTQRWPPGERIRTWNSAQPTIMPSPEPFYAQCWLCGRRHRPPPEIHRAVTVELPPGSMTAKGRRGSVEDYLHRDVDLSRVAAFISALGPEIFSIMAWAELDRAQREGHA